MNTRGIAFFDIDGTLVPSMSSSSFLARRLGHQAELDAAEQRYSAGELSNHDVSVVDAAGWRGTEVSTIDAWLDELPVIDGAGAVAAWCRAHAIEPVLASLAWAPVSTALARRLGFVANRAPRPNEVGGTYDGTVAEHFDEFDKRDSALRFASDRGIPASRCCAIGDSRSDIPLFGAVERSLALNAGPAARDAATDTIETGDLRNVLPWLAAWGRKLR